MIAKANPHGPIRVVTDDLSSHTSAKVRGWLARHRRIQQVFIPKRACWLNLAEGWWRLLRRAALAGQCFADTAEIAYAVQVATAQLNARARPWVWIQAAAPDPQTPPQVRVPPLRNVALATGERRGGPGYRATRGRRGARSPRRRARGSGLLAVM
jgi:DDE superfamily endonuclease